MPVLLNSVTQLITGFKKMCLFSGLFQLNDTGKSGFIPPSVLSVCLYCSQRSRCPDIM